VARITASGSNSRLPGWRSRIDCQKEAPHRRKVHRRRPMPQRHAGFVAIQPATHQRHIPGGQSMNLVSGRQALRRCQSFCRCIGDPFRSRAVVGAHQAKRHPVSVEIRALLMRDPFKPQAHLRVSRDASHEACELCSIACQRRNIRLLPRGLSGDRRTQRGGDACGRDANVYIARSRRHLLGRAPSEPIRDRRRHFAPPDCKIDMGSENMGQGRSMRAADCVPLLVRNGGYGRRIDDLHATGH
jgi:hypothetical protein